MQSFAQLLLRGTDGWSRPPFYMQSMPSSCCVALTPPPIRAASIARRVLQAVAWAEPSLVKEQLQLVPHSVSSPQYHKCLALALERALLLSLSKTDAEAVVKLLLDRRVDVALLTFRSLFNTAYTERAVATTEPRAADCSPPTGVRSRRRDFRE